MAKFNRLMRPSDFDSPSFVEDVAAATGYPELQNKTRKTWEHGRILHVLRELGYLQPDKTALGLGTLNEPVPYGLSNYLKHVYRTDYFTDDNVWTKGREKKIAAAKGRPAFVPETMKYQPDRVSFMEMDATNMKEFGNDSLDIVYSVSSIEHFGLRLKETHGSIACMQESERVLKPGGICLGTTEFLLNDTKHQQFYRRQEFEEEIINSHNMNAIEPFDYTLDEELYNSEYYFPFVLRDLFKEKHKKFDKYAGFILANGMVVVPIFFAFIKK